MFRLERVKYRSLSTISSSSVWPHESALFVCFSAVARNMKIHLCILSVSVGLCWVLAPIGSKVRSIGSSYLSKFVVYNLTHDSLGLFDSVCLFIVNDPSFFCVNIYWQSFCPESSTDSQTSHKVKAGYLVCCLWSLKRNKTDQSEGVFERPSNNKRLIYSLARLMQLFKFNLGGKKKKWLVQRRIITKVEEKKRIVRKITCKVPYIHD